MAITPSLNASSRSVSRARCRSDRNGLLMGIAPLSRSSSRDHDRPEHYRIWRRHLGPPHLLDTLGNPRRVGSPQTADPPARDSLRFAARWLTGVAHPAWVASFAAPRPVKGVMSSVLQKGNADAPEDVRGARSRAHPAARCPDVSWDRSPPPRALLRPSRPVGDFSGLVDIGGGRRLYLECAGQGSPTVVLEAGFRTRADLWSDDLIQPEAPRTMVFPGVAAFTRVCAYDRPGTTTVIEGGAAAKPQRPGGDAAHRGRVGPRPPCLARGRGVSPDRMCWSATPTAAC